MTPEDQAVYRPKLEALAEELRADLDSNADASQTVNLDTSIGRLSRMDAMQSQQMALELRRRQQNQLQRVESALARIAKGTFGLCGRCKKPISADRLDAQPDAVLCVGCAENR